MSFESKTDTYFRENVKHFKGTYIVVSNTQYRIRSIKLVAETAAYRWFEKDHPYRKHVSSRNIAHISVRRECLNKKKVEQG